MPTMTAFAAPGTRQQCLRISLSHCLFQFLRNDGQRDTAKNQDRCDNESERDDLGQEDDSSERGEIRYRELDRSGSGRGQT